MEKLAWSARYPKCICCGTTTVPFKSRGLCSNCYQKQAESRNSSHERQKKVAGATITREYLELEYLTNGKSSGDIAKVLGCSRQYIHRRLKELGVERRTKSEARVKAYNNGKLNYPILEADGNLRTVRQVKHIIQEDFFSKWSPEMAYVLGWMYTDGCLSPGRRLDPKKRTTTLMPRITLALSEIEPIQKVLSLMGAKSTILFRKETHNKGVTQGALYYFHINNEKIYSDLCLLGLKPNKSLDITFPKIPYEHLKHFIRGCWDGDGSVYLSGSSIVAHFVSGSLDFISELVRHLTTVGLPERTIHRVPLTEKNKNPNIFYITYPGSYAYRIFRYLYDDVPSEMFLERKYKVFVDFFARSDKQKMIQKA